MSLLLDKSYGSQISVALVTLIVFIIGILVFWRWFDENRNTLTKLWEAYRLAVAKHHPRLARFVAARFARGEYLGLHLTVGFAISVAGLWLFAGITEDVVTNDTLTQIDLAMVGWIRAHASPRGDAVFSAVSFAGSPLAMGFVSIAGALIIASRRNWLMLSAWISAFLGAGLLTTLLKLTIRRPRPSGAETFLHGETFSFPSGHSLGSLVGYGMLAFVIGSFWTEGRRHHVLVGAAAAILIVAIGVSRLYLGVHYFSDVIAGYAMGVLWLSACISGLQMIDRRRLFRSKACQ